MLAWYTIPPIALSILAAIARIAQGCRALYRWYGRELGRLHARHADATGIVLKALVHKEYDERLMNLQWLLDTTIQPEDMA